MQFKNLLLTVLALPCLTSMVHAHSWVEELDVVGANGSFIGKPGYIRGHASRRASGFNDDLMTHRLPPNGRPISQGILSTDPMCMPSQRRQRQAQGFPVLEASPGDFIIHLSQENGHVTLPETQPGKPKNRGTVFIYGTHNPNQEEKFLDVHGVWGKQGSLSTGVLLSRQNFDDGRCYQINGKEISQSRQQQYPHQPDELTGADLACQHVSRIPLDAQEGKLFTEYWVWEWPTAPGVDPNLPNGKPEVYTSCMDIKITASQNGTSKARMQFVQGPASNRVAIASLLANYEEPTSGSSDDNDTGSFSSSTPTASSSLSTTATSAASHQSTPFF